MTHPPRQIKIDPIIYPGSGASQLPARPAPPPRRHASGSTSSSVKRTAVPEESLSIATT
jgi:hypothetical protein